jgi:hypothetical protein
MKNLIIKKIIREIEKEKNRQVNKSVYLDVFNSGIIIDLEKIKKLSYEIAIKMIKNIGKNI